MLTECTSYGHNSYVIDIARSKVSTIIGHTWVNVLAADTNKPTKNAWNVIDHSFDNIYSSRHQRVPFQGARCVLHISM